MKVRKRVIRKKLHRSRLFSPNLFVSDKCFPYSAIVNRFLRLVVCHSLCVKFWCYCLFKKGGFRSIMNIQNIWIKFCKEWQGLFKTVFGLPKSNCSREICFCFFIFFFKYWTWGIIVDFHSSKCLKFLVLPSATQQTLCT